MPWRDVKPMEQRVLFIADYLRGHADNFAALCAAYGISRKTGYKWVKRYQDTGMDGLQERPRRPHAHPQAIPYAVKQKIIELRTRYQIVPGPKKIQVLLHTHYPELPVPSVSSIHNILKREGLITPRTRQRKVAPYRDPFGPVSQANHLWSVDFKGQFKLGNQQWCYPLTVMDHHSRFLLSCHGLSGTKTVSTQRVFTRLFNEYGLPARIRSDNGVPFASRAAGGLSALSIWWIKLGIVPERIQAGKPQQNGQHERMHRTLKRAVTRPPARSMRAQQHRMDAFKREYNEQRPHEALNQQTPHTHYTASKVPFPSTLNPIDYPGYYTVLKVRSSGVVYWSGGQVYVSHLLVDERVGMVEVDDGMWEIYFGPVRLGGFDQRKVKGKATPYWTLNV